MVLGGQSGAIKSWSGAVINESLPTKEVLDWPCPPQEETERNSELERPGGTSLTVKPVSVMIWYCPQPPSCKKWISVVSEPLESCYSRLNELSHSAYITVPQSSNPGNAHLYIPAHLGEAGEQRDLSVVVLFCFMDQSNWPTKRLNPCLLSQWTKSVINRESHSESSCIEKGFHLRLSEALEYKLSL